MKARHRPQRTCIACREVRDQRDLVRLVRAPEGVVVDRSARGRTPGRGAYLCRRVACWERALKTSRSRGGGPLGHALRAGVTDDDRARLEAFARTLPEERPDEQPDDRPDGDGEPALAAGATDASTTKTTKTTDTDHTTSGAA